MLRKFRNYVISALAPSSLGQSNTPIDRQAALPDVSGERTRQFKLHEVLQIILSLDPKIFCRFICPTGYHSHGCTLSALRTVSKEARHFVDHFYWGDIKASNDERASAFVEIALQSPFGILGRVCTIQAEDHTLHFLPVAILIWPSSVSVEYDAEDLLARPLHEAIELHPFRPVQSLHIRTPITNADKILVNLAQLQRLPDLRGLSVAISPSVLYFPRLRHLETLVYRSGPGHCLLGIMGGSDTMQSLTLCSRVPLTDLELLFQRDLAKNLTKLAFVEDYVIQNTEIIGMNLRRACPRLLALLLVRCPSRELCKTLPKNLEYLGFEVCPDESPRLSDHHLSRTKVRVISIRGGHAEFVAAIRSRLVVGSNIVDGPNPQWFANKGANFMASMQHFLDRGGELRWPGVGHDEDHGPDEVEGDGFPGLPHIPDAVSSC